MMMEALAFLGQAASFPLLPDTHCCCCCCYYYCRRLTGNGRSVGFLGEAALFLQALVLALGILQLPSQFVHLCVQHEKAGAERRKGWGGIGDGDPSALAQMQAGVPAFIATWRALQKRFPD